MAITSDDSSWWPLINGYRVFSYFVVASCTAVVYDWILNLGQEIDLIWRQHWSPMTVLYISVRYIGVLYAVTAIQLHLPSVSVTDTVRVSETRDGPASSNDSNSCNFMACAFLWMAFVVNTILGVITIARLYAMYQRSRKMLIFLVATFTAVMITFGVMIAIRSNQASAESLLLSGTYQCRYKESELVSLTWLLSAAWEFLALCLAVWITVKHFRERSRFSTRWSIGDCYTVLIKSHVLYFAALAAASCFNLVELSSKKSRSLGVQVYYGIFQFAVVMQMFVLGPRLIMGVRQYHAKLVVNSDFATGMTSIAFEEHCGLSMSTCSDVDV